MECRICKGTEMVDIIDFGDIYPSAFLKEDELPGKKYPLTLVECVNCGLVQLTENPPLDTMYRQYWYRSGLNKSMVDDLKSVINSIYCHIRLEPMDLIIDIGCNDGALFQFYPKDVITVGYDPALNLNPKCDIFINDYFPTRDKLPKKAKVITSIAMFYDLPDPNKFIEGIKKYLTEDGIWVIQLTDLASMYSITAFDNICHEHLEYYTLKNLINLMDFHGLQIFDASYNNVNGGSLRILVNRRGKRKVNPIVESLLLTESSLLYKNWANEFKSNIISKKNKVFKYLSKAKTDGKTIALLGASTKGNTLLQVWDITYTLVNHAAEINPDKFGLRTVDTDIPIISQEESLALSPDIYLVLPYHFISTWKKFLLDHKDKNLKLLLPLPLPRILSIENDQIVERLL